MAIVKKEDVVWLVKGRLSKPQQAEIVRLLEGYGLKVTIAADEPARQGRVQRRALELLRKISELDAPTNRELGKETVFGPTVAAVKKLTSDLYLAGLLDRWPDESGITHYRVTDLGQETLAADNRGEE